jgi:integrase
VPNLKLTEKSVERIPLVDADAENPQVAYYDTRLPGFGVKAGKKARTYFVAGRVGKEKFHHIIGRTNLISFDEAYDQAQEILKAANKGIAPQKKNSDKKDVAPVKIVSLNNILIEYCAARKKIQQSTKDLYGIQLNRYVPDWLDLPMSQITPAMVAQKHTEVGQKSKAQSDAVFRVIRALYNFAMDVHEEEVTRNPVTRLSSTKAWYNVPRKNTYIKPTQLPMFFSAIKKHPGVVADYLETLLFTGVRSASEIATLQLQHVDFREESIFIPDTKTGVPLEVPVCKSVIAILKRRCTDAKAQGTTYLFYAFQEQAARNGEYKPKKDATHLKDVRGTIKAIFDGSELAGITPHDTRRSYLTYADELEIPNIVQKRLVGHAIPTDVTDGYKFLTMDRLRKAVIRLEQYILINAKPKKKIN